MKVNTGYIFNSAWWLTVDDTLLIFDYYTGTVPLELIKKAKKTIVFASHSHSDHYSSKIFDWDSLGDVSYVLSYDITAAPAKNRFIMRPGDEISIDGIVIRAYGSTDLGCSFHIDILGLKVFHAGDFNLWHWKDESTKSEIEEANEMFYKVLEPIKKREIDIAFFPVDARLISDYDEGAKIFMEVFSPKVFCPLHFRMDYDCLKQFKDWLEDKYKETVFANVTDKDQVFQLGEF